MTRGVLTSWTTSPVSPLPLWNKAPPLGPLLHWAFQPAEKPFKSAAAASPQPQRLSYLYAKVFTKVRKQVQMSAAFVLVLNVALDVGDDICAQMLNLAHLQIPLKTLFAPIVNSDLFSFSPTGSFFAALTSIAASSRRCFLNQFWPVSAERWGLSPTCLDQSRVFSRCSTKAIYLSTRLAWPLFTESRLPLWGQIQGPVLCSHRYAISSPSMQCQGVMYTLFSDLSHK